MKRYGQLWEKICDTENIELAAVNSVKGKKQTRARRIFLENRERLLKEVQESLVNETYQFKPLQAFTVYEPKQRSIHCSPFYPDKILHHCVMNIIKPLFVEKFTADIYGSINRARCNNGSKQVKKGIQQQTLIICKWMPKHFYQSIDHEIMKQQVRRVIKCNKTLKMLDAIIDVHDEGLAIGVFPSQYLSNLIMCPIDHWAKKYLEHLIISDIWTIL